MVCLRAGRHVSVRDSARNISISRRRYLGDTGEIRESLPLWSIYSTRRRILSRDAISRCEHEVLRNSQTTRNNVTNRVSGTNEAKNLANSRRTSL